MTAQPNRSLDADTGHCAARRVGEHTPCGAMPLRAVNSNVRPTSLVRILLGFQHSN